MGGKDGRERWIMGEWVFRESRLEGVKGVKQRERE